MKPRSQLARFLFFFGASVALAQGTLLAGGDGKTILAPEEPVLEEKPQFRLSAEYNIEETYFGEGTVSRGRRSANDFSESNTVVSVVLTPRVSFGVLRLGASYDRFWFDFSDGVQLPDVLQSANLVVGLDTQFSDSILFRIEAQPGFYGGDMDKWDSSDLNVPFLLGGTYIYSPALQFVLGVGVDVNRQYPVVPGGGIRWKFAPDWVLNAVLPTPRLEYTLSPKLLLYAGADVRSTTFRVDESFGDRHADSSLNGAVIDYTELRTGAGVDWKISSAFTLTAEVGYLAWREFDFHRTDVRYHTDEGAPYGRISLHGAF